MERTLQVIDKYLGWVYVNMFTVITDSGDFIQGLKRLLIKEMQSIIDLIFDFGLKVCVAFIALDIFLYYFYTPVNIIPLTSKVIALLFILTFKYNVNKTIAQSITRIKKKKAH